MCGRIYVRVCVCVILYTKTAVARNAVVTPLCKADWYEQRERAWLIEGGFKQRCDHDNTCMLFIGTRHPMLFIGPRLPTGSAFVSLQLQFSIENLTMFPTFD